MCKLTLTSLNNPEHLNSVLSHCKCKLTQCKLVIIEHSHHTISHFTSMCFFCPSSPCVEAHRSRGLCHCLPRRHSWLEEQEVTAHDNPPNMLLVDTHGPAEFSDHRCWQPQKPSWIIVSRGPSSGETRLLHHCFCSNLSQSLSFLLSSLRTI